jgi:hypothetical protein
VTALPIYSAARLMRHAFGAILTHYLQEQMFELH